MITINELPQKIVIIGTDTEIGKTHIACQIIKSWNANNVSIKNILALKPLVSGSLNNSEPFQWDDIERLKKTGVQTQYFYGFQPAISPDAAALLLSPHIILSVDKLVTKINQTISNNNASHVLIEGVGGVFVPLNDTESFLDVLVTLKIPVVLVIGMKLGGINHALLTLESLNNRNIIIAGWIANELPHHQVPFYMLERLQQRFSQQGISQISL